MKPATIMFRLELPGSAPSRRTPGAAGAMSSRNPAWPHRFGVCSGCRKTVTMFELPPAPARARIVAAHLGFLGRVYRGLPGVRLHDLVGPPALTKQVRHDLHGGVDMVEEQLVAGT